MKKRMTYIAVLCGMAALVFLFLYQRPYQPSSDEAAIRIHLNTDADIGLIVYDYFLDGQSYSGGISNADRSRIRKDSSDNLVILNRSDLNIHQDPIEMRITFRIITEYVDPNFENIYPEQITEYTAPLNLKLYYGKVIDLSITGNRNSGYQISMIKPE
ncbi:MAG: hypothetical protein ACI32N_06195 [Bulleidia sp.]